MAESKNPFIEALLSGQKHGTQAYQTSVKADDDQVNKLLRLLTIQNLQDERKRKAVQDVEDRSTKANTASVGPALKRAEEAIPGLYSGSAPVQLKSVGGFKNLVPDFAAVLAEKVGILPQGAAKERTALQEIQNMKLYDSSGKQINEQEMKRINKASGLSGLFGSEDIVPALRQMGNTAFQKQQQVSAGADPEALQTFRARGGQAGFKSLGDLLKAQPSMEPTTTAPKQRKVVGQQRNKKTGAVRNVYDDGSTD